ncbi:hypothetical protein, partial [Massilia scottii]|uniref:hypothetical protein n=1 Tax=Massilia scottii TaxID=3057166 RepID=UPI0027966173
ERASEVIGALAQLDHKRQCELLYFDESGFIQSESAGAVRLGQDWSDPVGRTAGASAARQRAWGITPRRSVGFDDAAAADHT